MKNSLFKRIPSGKVVKNLKQISTNEEIESCLYSLNYYVVTTEKEEHVSLKKLTYLQVKNLLGENYNKANIYIVTNHLVELEDAPAPKEEVKTSKKKTSSKKEKEVK